MGSVNGRFLSNMGIASIIAGLILLLTGWLWARAGG